jgi:hypothetical protein
MYLTASRKVRTVNVNVPDDLVQLEGLVARDGLSGDVVEERGLPRVLKSRELTTLKRMHDARCLVHIGLKGQCHEVFNLRFFDKQLLLVPIACLETISNFLEYSH